MLPLQTDSLPTFFINMQVMHNATFTAIQRLKVIQHLKNSNLTEFFSIQPIRPPKPEGYKHPTSGSFTNNLYGVRFIVS